MKAYLINANEKTIEAVNIDGLPDIKALIGYETVDSDEVDASGDRLFFDESCFLRDQSGKGRFKLDNLAPVADRAVVIGARGDGTPLQDAAVSLEQLTSRIRWL